MKKIITVAAVSIMAAASVLGCSGFAWHTEDGCHLLGRTYDMFGDLSGNRITVIAPGYELHTSPSGEGKTVTMKYGFIGAMPELISSSDGSFCGMSEKLGKRRCPLVSKNFRYISRSSFKLLYCICLYPPNNDFTK